MCGIFGYATYNHRSTMRAILNVLLDGLKKVEYRGYDSAGLCVSVAPTNDDHTSNATNDKPQSNEYKVDDNTNKSNKDNNKSEKLNDHAKVESVIDGTSFIIRSEGNIDKLRHKVFDKECNDAVANTTNGVNTKTIKNNNNNNIKANTNHASIDLINTSNNNHMSYDNNNNNNSNSTDAVVVASTSGSNNNNDNNNNNTTKTTTTNDKHTINFEEVVINSVSLAHTRWATHGEVCERNCHPQRSNKGEFTIVHNGIMTNYSTVKQFLSNEGYFFTSDTDTEVICVLAEYLHTRKGLHSFVELAAQLSRFVEGAYALVIISSYFPNEMIGCRRGSPLVVAVKEYDVNGVEIKKHHHYASIDPHNALEVFLASDCNSFAQYTNNIVYLEDGDIVHYAHGSLSFYTAGEMIHESVSRAFQTLETTLESLSKGNYPHFMLKEICEQRETVISSMRGRVDFSTGRVHLGGFTQSNIRNIQNSRRLILISCGTSMHSCLAIRPMMEELLPLPIQVENASDFIDRTPHITRADVVFFVSQSGETADVLMALKHCRECGALCVGITNVVGSSISRLTDFGSHLNAGAEVGVASTKAYTSQIVVLTLITLLLSADNLEFSERRTEILNGLSSLSSKIQSTLQSTTEPIKRLAQRLQNVHSLIILGRGYDNATAMEGALKVKELSYVHTEGINSGELKHGPLALVDENMPIIAVCANDKHFTKSKAAIQQVYARKGKVVVITNTANDVELNGAASELIVVSQITDCLQCVINVIPFQLLAYYMALYRGNNIDCPRNLAKSVTVQ